MSHVYDSKAYWAEFTIPDDGLDIHYGSWVNASTVVWIAPNPLEQLPGETDEEHAVRLLHES